MEYYDETELPGQEQLVYLDGVWGTTSAFVEIEQRRKDDDGNRTGSPTDVKMFKWPMERERIGRYIESRLDDDLYYAVPMYERPKRQQEFVMPLSVVYVDDDGVTGEYKIEPTYRVNSSPAHSHQYWVLDRPYDAAEVSAVGEAISAHHRHDSEFHDDITEQERKNGEKAHKFCGTDPGGWDLTQILRIPGSKNRKPEYAGLDFTVNQETLSGQVYTLGELQAAYPPLEKSQARVAHEMANVELPEHLPPIDEILTRFSMRPDLLDLFITEPQGIGTSNGWDERLYALENELFRMGLSVEEVYVVAWHSACNKFKRGVRNADGVTFSPRPHPEEDLWRDVRKAAIVHADRQSDWVAPLEEGGLVVQEQQAPGKRDKFRISVTTAEERACAEAEYTFIDAYREWATSKTDAAEVFHEASAFTILSVIFGEYGHVPAKFGNLRLNLWFLVMGRTTRARKSTSRDLMMKVIDGCSISDWTYDLGGDFTAEGLTDALMERNKRSSLVHRDEVQGLFKDIINKTYMQGLNDVLTDLYGGWIRRKIRAGGLLAGQSDKVQTNFILFFMGVIGKITSVLRLEDFESGFLARFIHVIGEAPPRTRETEWLDQASPAEIAKGDPKYSELVMTLLKRRAGWHKRNPDRDTVPIRFTEEAWRRWNEANWDLQESIQSHNRAEILEASFDRLGKSCLKAAALLAMSQDKEMVELEHMLVALTYTEKWAEGIVASAELVSESFWKKDLRTLQDVILKKGGTMKWEEAYSKMDKTPMEFKNLVEGLVMSSMAKINVDMNTKIRWIEAT